MQQDVASIPDEAPKTQPLSSKLAISSLVLGILSICASFICVGVLFGILAIVFAIVSLLRISKGKAAGKNIAIAGILTGAVGLMLSLVISLILAGMLLPALNSAREKARRISCATNLKQIALAVKMYALDNADKFPDGNGVAGLEKLRKLRYLDNPNIFVCPTSGVRPAAPGAPIAEANCSYLYLGSGKDESVSPDTPIACDNPANHRNYGNVLYADGHVQGFAGSDWPAKAGLK
jgi:prepilin-type processing-associated H-X9-DG protein